MQNWPVPSNQKRLHSFLGLASYHRCFIPKFAVISKCLHELVCPTHIKKGRGTKAETTENGNFQWTDEHKKAFDLLQAHLTSTPVLRQIPHYKDWGMFYLRRISMAKARLKVLI